MDGDTLLACPHCGGTRFEEVGDVRCYQNGRLVRDKDGDVQFRSSDDIQMPFETYELDLYRCLTDECQNEWSMDTGPTLATDLVEAP